MSHNRHAQKMDQDLDTAAEPTFSKVTVTTTPDASDDNSGAILGNLKKLSFQDLVLGEQTTPPGSPTLGDRYLVDNPPTDAWAGHAGHIAEWDGSAWKFYVPEDGWIVYNAGNGQLLKHTGTWTVFKTLTENEYAALYKLFRQELDDPLLYLNDDETGAGTTDRFSGMMINRGSLSPVGIVWDETNDLFANHNGNVGIGYNNQAGGTYQTGEIIEGNVTGEMATVVSDSGSGTVLVWKRTSGSFLTGEVLTGQTSGVTSNASGDNIDELIRYFPFWNGVENHNAIAFYDGSAGQFTTETRLTWDGTTLNVDGGAVFNEAGNDRDFRVEGDTDPNLLFADASTDRVGIGTSTPAKLLDVDGEAQATNIYATTGLILPKTSGLGIKVDPASPSFGWRDITSDISVKGGSNTPTWAVFRTNISAYQFDVVGDEVWHVFHIPHDYVPGSELYIHAHWGLDTADTANSITWGFDATFQKRNDTTPAAFPATTNKTVTHDASAINVPQYGHVVSEVQLTDGSGQLGGVAIEVDGLILCRTYLSADAGNIDPFLFTVDLHYQSNNMATKNRAPDFYA